MSKKLMEFQGSGHTGKNSKIELYEDKIVIVKKKGGLAAAFGTPGGSTGDRTIFLDQIASIQVYAGGLASPGFIRFLLSGSSQEAKYVAADAIKDHNAVVFVGKKDAELANKFKEEIEELKSSLRKAGAPQVQVSGADEIKKYKQLLDDGIITEEEFNKKKRELLGL